MKEIKIECSLYLWYLSKEGKMDLPIKELVEEKPTLFSSEIFSGLKRNCLYFLFRKEDEKEILPST